MTSRSSPRRGFALAFTCLGLESRLGAPVSMQGGRPAAAFVGADVGIAVGAGTDVAVEAGDVCSCAAIHATLRVSSR